ncbi:MAG: asparaginase [Clostridia bacterium]|nr:asparaginase [Clostridia bacterium]
MEILANSFRGDFKDLIYTGHIAVVDYEGNLLYYCGDPEKVAFARSSAKPMQTMCAMESGAIDAFCLSEDEISLLCASHNGEKMHENGVRSILSKAGLDESYLQCGKHAPFDAPSAKALEDAGIPFSEIHCNCSGKHSGMLITAKHLGESLDDYYTRPHNVQQRITNMIADLCCYDADKIVLGTDGCGVPVHALPLKNFALGIARLAKADCLPGKRAEYAKRITTAMRNYPLMMSGTGRIDAALMDNLNVFAKSGADGYFIVGLIDQGIAMAVKIDDGNGDVRDMVVVEALRQLGVINEENAHHFAKWAKKEVRNHKEELVGYTLVDFQLHKAE